MEVWEGILRMLEEEGRGYMALTDLARVHIDILLEDNVLSVLVISGCNILVNYHIYFRYLRKKAPLQLLIQSLYGTCQGPLCHLLTRNIQGRRRLPGAPAHV
jgi:hypothetical protein